MDIGQKGITVTIRGLIYPNDENPMSNSMMDQLKKAGLVDKKKQQQVKKEKHKARRKPGKQAHSNDNQAASLAQEAEQQKRARDRALNQQRKEAAEQTAILAQIKQLIDNHHLPLEGGETAFHFTHDKKVKHLYVTEKIQQQLSAGYLAIVTLNEQYNVVPRPIAEKIEQRNAAHVIWTDTTSDSNAPDDEDPYADYAIPDDLMW